MTLAVLAAAVVWIIAPFRVYPSAHWPAFPSVASLIERSDLVIVGKVEGVDHTLTDGTDGPLYTIFKVSLVETLKGDATGQSVKVIQYGGKSGPVIIESKGSPLARAGHTYLMFLEKDRSTGDDRYAVLGGSQGRLLIGQGEVLEPESEVPFLEEIRGKKLSDLRKQIKG